MYRLGKLLNKSLLTFFTPGPSQIQKHLDKNNDFAIKKMTLKDFEGPVTDWHNEMQSFRTIQGEKAIYLSDKDGWYLALKNEELIGSLGCLQYSDSAWLSYFYIKPAYRNRGLGASLLHSALAESRLRGIRSFSFDCVSSLIPYYEKAGFKKEENSDFVMRYDFQESYGEFTVKYNNMEFTDEVLSKICTYDSKIRGTSRNSFVCEWLTKEDTDVLLTMDNNKQVTGYLVKSVFNFPGLGDWPQYRIGPLYADNEDLAMQMLSAALPAAKHKKYSIFIDVDGRNPKAKFLVDNLGFFIQPNLKLARMSMADSEGKTLSDKYDTTRVYGLSWVGGGP